MERAGGRGGRLLFFPQRKSPTLLRRASLPTSPLTPLLAADARIPKACRPHFFRALHIAQIHHHATRHALAKLL